MCHFTTLGNGIHFKSTRKILNRKHLLTNRVLRPQSYHICSSCSSKNHYQTLGVLRNATTNDIKKAYYMLAKKYHPDSNKHDPEASAKFQEVVEAYHVLRDNEQRRRYDNATLHLGNSTKLGDFGGRTAEAVRKRANYWRSHRTINGEELLSKIFCGSIFQSMVNSSNIYNIVKSFLGNEKNYENENEENKTNNDKNFFDMDNNDYKEEEKE